MKPKVKVAVLATRLCEFKSVSIPADDSIPVTHYGTIDTTYRTYFSDTLVDKDAAIEAVKPILPKYKFENFNLSIDSSYIDITRIKIWYDRNMTQQAVEKLSAALPGYDFEAAKTDEEAHILSLPKIKVNVRSHAEEFSQWESAGACADVTVEPEAFLITYRILHRTISFSEIPDQKALLALSERLAILLFSHSKDITFKRDITPENDQESWSRIIVGALSESDKDTLFVSDPEPQPEVLTFACHKPFICSMLYLPLYRLTVRSNKSERPLCRILKHIKRLPAQ